MGTPPLPWTRGEPAGQWKVIRGLGCNVEGGSSPHLAGAEKEPLQSASYCVLPPRDVSLGALCSSTHPALLALLGMIVLNLRSSLPAGNSCSMLFLGLPFLVLSSSSAELDAGSFPWPSGSSLQPPSATVEPRLLLRDKPGSVCALLKQEKLKCNIYSN